MSLVPISGHERAFTSWLSMMRRCFLSSVAGFSDYGGRGISVCERWYDWRNFLADMGERPDGFSLDRIDPNGNYEPSNCRWADAVTQNRNTRRNVTVEVGGVLMLARDAAKVLGVSESSISRRRRAAAPLAERRPLKLTAAQAQQIKARLDAGLTNTAIAAEFGVTRQHVGQIKAGKVWRTS